MDNKPHFPYNHHIRVYGSMYQSILINADLDECKAMARNMCENDSQWHTVHIQDCRSFEIIFKFYK